MTSSAGTFASVSRARIFAIREPREEQLVGDDLHGLREVDGTPRRVGRDAHVVLAREQFLVGESRRLVAELEGLYGHLEEASIASGFLDPANPGRLRERWRRLFARARPEKEEINILRGLLRALGKRGNPPAE